MRLFFICVILPVLLGLFISLAAFIFISLIDFYIDEALTECDPLTELRYKGVIHAYTLQHYSISYSACGHDSKTAES